MSPLGTHFWNSEVGVPSRVVECDWCIWCSCARPGYKDPKTKWE